ncbi:MAG: hypothetical protein AB4352_14665 [Hormoscilla sp.]
MRNIWGQNGHKFKKGAPASFTDNAEWDLLDDLGNSQFRQG